ncbi:MAG: hypothetical protein ACREO7_09790 [Pseudoxanthomonas sp.]
MQQTLPPSRPARWLAPTMLFFGGILLTLLWMLLALYLGRPCGWMAVASALAFALMLRLGGMPRGWPRAASAVLGTLLTIALVNWAIAAAQIGASLGLDPWDSALKLGSDYAWTLAKLANETSDRAWMGLALVVAAIAGR